MRFLIDAQLPRRLSHEIARQGFDTLHTLDLPDKNHTPDFEIIQLAAKQDRIVVTKDSDFVASYWYMGCRQISSLFQPAIFRTTNCAHSSNQH